MPVPAMLKLIASAPAVLLAAVIASRNEIFPSAPLSASSASTLDTSPSDVSLVVSTVTVWSVTAVRLIVSVTAALVPPSPSVSTKRTVRADSLGFSETFSYVMLRIRACAATGVALLLSVMTNGVEPSVPPVNVPIVTAPAPKLYVTSEPLTPICPAPVPSSRIANRSLAVLPAVKSTVNVPVSKSAESGSLTVAVASITTAPSPSV